MKCYIVYNDVDERAIWGVFDNLKAAEKLRDILNEKYLYGVFLVEEQKICKSLVEYQNSTNEFEK